MSNGSDLNQSVSVRLMLGLAVLVVGAVLLIPKTNCYNAREVRIAPAQTASGVREYCIHRVYHGSAERLVNTGKCAASQAAAQAHLDSTFTAARGGKACLGARTSVLSDAWDRFIAGR